MPDLTIPEAAVEAALVARVARVFEPGYQPMPSTLRAMREHIREDLTPAAPHIVAQGLRDAEREMPCEHHGSCLIAGNDGCAAPEDGGMLRAAILRRANRIEANS